MTEMVYICATKYDDCQALDTCLLQLKKGTFNLFHFN